VRAQVVAGDGFTFALAEDGAVHGCGQFKDDVCSTKHFSPDCKLARTFVSVYEPPSVRDAVVKLAAGARAGRLRRCMGRSGACPGWGRGTHTVEHS
jgi:hypothetical protein